MSWFIFLHTATGSGIDPSAADSRAAAASRNRLALPPAEKQTARRQASRNYGAPPPPKFLRRAAACSDYRPSRGDWKCETGKWSTKMLLIAMRSSTLSEKSNPLDTVFFSDTVYKRWTCCARRTWFTSTPRSALSHRCIISCSQSSCRMLTTHSPSRTRLWQERQRSCTGVSSNSSVT